MTLGERIKKVRTDLTPKMSQEEFAASLGKTRTAYVMYEVDRVVPDKTFLKLLCSEYEVSMRWLETGEGDPYIKRDDSYSLVEEIRDITKNEHPLMAAVMASLAEMPPEWWDEWSKRLHEEADRVNKKKEGT
ncbi:MAG: helix-turn-helix transcriptional regulator [Clostridia bacterium]|nr:helix-turn-helix transcriptional regulator [Clostridia bacterium]